MNQWPQMFDAQSDGIIHGCLSFALHTPLVQVLCPDAHFVPHTPQFELSVARGTQLPLQSLWPAAQQIAALAQLPLAH